MLREILEARSAKTKSLMKDLETALTREGISFRLKKSIMSDALELENGMKIGVATVFHDMYTIMNNGKEALNTASTDEVIDFIQR